MYSINVIKVLWLSHHKMTDEQIAALEQCCRCELRGTKLEINQVNRTIENVSELSNEIMACDVFAVAVPVELQVKLLNLMRAGGFEKPMIVAKTERIFTEEGRKQEFKFVCWERIKSIKIEKEDFILPLFWRCTS